MKAWHFSETAYPYLPPEDTYDSIRVTLPNRLIDPKKAAELWDRYIDEWVAAEALGMHVMVNEHHATATCMDSVGPLIAAVMARETSTARILILGNPIANRRDPIRVAEEMAMIDVLSRGRLEVGFVRGVPYEVFPQNSNPVRMADRLWEAHDLIKKAWTTHDGPFSWQGQFFEHRQVNIIPRPYQQPHPPIWVTSLTPGSAKLVAAHGYVAATFLTGKDGTRTVFDAYRAERERMGEETNPDRLAYAALVYTGRTYEEGIAGAEKLMWYINANKVPPQFSGPPGYVPAPVRGKVLQGHRSPFALSNLTMEELLEKGIVFAGDPDTVAEQIADFYQYVGPFGHLLNMGQAGFLEHEETLRGLELFSREVQPRLEKALGPVAA